MLPVFATLPYLKFYTFGIFLAIGFLWGAFLLWRSIRLTSYKEELIFDGLFISLFFGLLLGRLVHVTLHPQEFGLDIIKFLLIHAYPGISLFGFIIGAILTLLVYFAYHKIKFSTLDYFASPALLAIAIGKLGSFIAGVEPGTLTKLPMAIKYAGYDGLRHLTSLYASIIFFIVSFLIYRVLMATRRESLYSGTSLWLTLGTISLVSIAFFPITQFSTTVYLYAFSGLLLTSILVMIYYYVADLYKSVLSIITLRKKNNDNSENSVVQSKVVSKSTRARRKKKQHLGSDGEVEGI